MIFGMSMDFVNLNYQEPNRNRRESKYFWDEMYTLITAAGFDTIELPYEPKWDFGGRSGIPLTARSIKVKYKDSSIYLRALKNAGIQRITGIHLDPSLFISGNLDMYFGAFSHFAKEAVEFAKDIDAEYLSLTPTPSVYALQNICPADKLWSVFADEFLAITSQVIDELALFSAQTGVKLCLKNEFWSLLPAGRIIPFIKKLNNQVFWDADTAHLKISGVDPQQLIQENLPLLGCMHLIDTAYADGTQGGQPMPEFPVGRATQVFRDLGHGTVDLAAICNLLKDAEYIGPIICSSRQTRDPYRTLLRTRSYINTKLSSLL